MKEKQTQMEKIGDFKSTILNVEPNHYLWCPVDYLFQKYYTKCRTGGYDDQVHIHGTNFKSTILNVEPNF